MDALTRTKIFDKLVNLAHVKDLLPDYKEHSNVRPGVNANKNLFISLEDLDKILCETQEEHEL